MASISVKCGSIKPCKNTGIDHKCQPSVNAKGRLPGPERTVAAKATASRRLMEPKA